MSDASMGSVRDACVLFFKLRTPLIEFLGPQPL